MISIESAASFLAEFNDQSKKTNDMNYLLSLIAEFTRAEPNFIAVLSTIFQVVKFENALSGCLFSLALLKKLQSWQSDADDLKKRCG